MTGAPGQNGAALGAALLLASVLSVGTVCRAGARPAAQDSLLAVFRKSVPDREILLTAVGDCNADNVEDLVIIYRESENENHMVAVYSDGGAFRVSAWVRAPLENYRMQWRDIDEMPPVELLVSGQKGIYIGFAVFRFVKGEWISLFGEGMEGCC